MPLRPSIALALTCLALPLRADPPDILAVTATRDGNDRARFDVTLAHPDTGWDHYADGWRVEDETGKVLAVRELLHPHVHEQPFKRSLGGVTMVHDSAPLFIRARCSVDGWSEHRAQVPLDD
ncbi:hypothetical protein [Shimia biformata]|uniref:hypothetical protein n=1 Tax=Shimia biformata TaxID=1294299 RepID=UPI00195247FD|nr:hypothetical protein [Shimia biformata]